MHTQPVNLPVLQYPFPCAVNPHAEAVEQHTLAWADHFKLITTTRAAQRFRAARFGWLAAFLAPCAAPHTLHLLSDWTTWAILWDDQCDHLLMQRHPEQLARWSRTLLAVLRGSLPPQPESPLAWSLWDLRQRFTHATTSQQFHAFVSTVEAFFAGCLWEVTNRAAGRVPDVATYIPMRRMTSGMDTAFELVVSLERIVLPPALRQHPQLHHLQKLATNSVCWANDLISLPKELQRGDVHNLVVVLQQAEQLSLQAAVDRTAAWHDAAVQAFVVTERALPVCEPPVAATLDRYVALLQSFMRGNVDWSALSGRYQPAGRVETQELTSILPPAIAAQRRRETPS